jgi:hypothetical protein
MKNVEKLLKVGHFRQPGKEGNPTTGQTVSKNLRARLKDYEAMESNRNDMHCFTKPGSLKK